MARVIKNSGKMVQAYELKEYFESSEVQRKLVAEGKIALFKDEVHLISQETKSGTGEVANYGDFFKVDNAGYPYPNERSWFLANHRHVEGDTYEQLPKPLLAWETSEPITPEIVFLITHKGLKLNPGHPETYFSSKLWGTKLTADSNAVLIFYSITRDDDGNIVDADYNFVARKEFDATYHYC